MADKLLGLSLPPDYQPSDGELDNLIYVVLKYTVGWPMRQADKAVCMVAGGDAIRGDAGISKLVYETCQYAWDHIAGEPDDFDADKLFDHIKPAILNWYENSTPEQRSKTD